MKTHLNFQLWFCTSVVLLCVAAWGKDPPDAIAILQSVRNAQANETSMVTGRLRKEGLSAHFTLRKEGQMARFEFKDPAQSLIVRFEDQDVLIEQIDMGKRETLVGARLLSKVRGTDISFEDLSMRFLYWPGAVYDHDETVGLMRCWVVEVQAPAKELSEYGRVMLWITQAHARVMQVEAYDRSGQKLLRKFRVVSSQKDESGNWSVKQMRIEAAPFGKGGKRAPTYVEIDKQ